MGNQPITISIDTCSSDYVPGTTINGKVFTSIASEVPHSTAYCLQLRLVGKEILKIGQYEEEEDHFLHMEYPLHVFSNFQAKAGQFAFPFSLELPANLPSTMSYRYGQRSGRIEYEIVAEVVQDESSISCTRRLRIGSTETPMSMLKSAIPLSPKALRSRGHWTQEHVHISAKRAMVAGPTPQ